jgi:hypothetical protein
VWEGSVVCIAVGEVGIVVEEGRHIRQLEEQDCRILAEDSLEVAGHHMVLVKVTRHIALGEDIVVQQVARKEVVDSHAGAVDHNLVEEEVGRILAADSLEEEVVDHMVVVQAVRRKVADLEEDKENERAAERRIRNLVVDMPSCNECLYLRRMKRKEKSRGGVNKGQEG